MLSFVVVAEPPPTWAACAEQFRADWRLAAPTLPVHPKIDARIFATWLSPVEPAEAFEAPRARLYARARRWVMLGGVRRDGGAGGGRCCWSVGLKDPGSSVGAISSEKWGTWSCHEPASAHCLMQPLPSWESPVIEWLGVDAPVRCQEALWDLELESIGKLSARCGKQASDLSIDVPLVGFPKAIDNAPQEVHFAAPF